MSKKSIKGKRGRLTNDEALAIRWYMQAWDLPFQSYDIKGNFNKAKEIHV